VDTDDLDPPKKKRLEPPVLEELSIEELEDYIVELEAAAGRAREVIKSKKAARGAADSVFKS
jgi:uncharacterized small protein (DUF1192 family)